MQLTLNVPGLGGPRYPDGMNPVVRSREGSAVAPVGAPLVVRPECNQGWAPDGFLAIYAVMPDGALVAISDVLPHQLDDEIHWLTSETCS